jgi:lipopolysaccharide export system protein LptA
MRSFTLALTLATLAAVPSVSFAETGVPSSSPNLLDPKAFDSSFGKLPTNITSDALTFNAKDRVFAYQGNVQVTQGDMRLTSKTLEGTYNEKNELQKLVAKGDVLITKQDIQATGQIASYDAVAAIVTLTDNPQLQQKESILRADKIKIFLNENRSQAEGDVRVTFVNTKDGAPGLAVAANPMTTPAPRTTATPTPKPAASAVPATKTPAPKAKKQATPKPKATKKK